MNIFGKLFPPGVAFSPRPGGNLDKIYRAINEVIVQALLKIGVSCGLTWDARKCSDLNSLSDEYGVEIFRNGDEVLYREYLRSFTVKDREWRSQADRMQELIRTAGFSAVMVVKKNILDDPRRWTEQRSTCFFRKPGPVVKVWIQTLARRSATHICQGWIQWYHHRAH